MKRVQDRSPTGQFALDHSTQHWVNCPAGGGLGEVEGGCCGKGVRADNCRGVKIPGG